MTDPTLTAIPAQPKLPLKVAVAIVRQGMRIRLGRSFVTLLGVALGIAFLMATLTTQVLRRGVAHEERLREAANRRYAALVSETGSLYGKRLSLVAGGAIDDGETRLLARLSDDGVRGIKLHSGTTLPPGLATPPLERAGASWARQSAGVLVLGSSPPSIARGELDAGPPPPLVAFTRASGVERLEGVTLVALDRPRSTEELASAEREAERERFRTAWIVAVSLLVTVIGIANSMLMSVTERFRDIGTMRCLGALSGFVRTLFLVEAAFMGVVGGVLGALGGALFALASYLLPYGAGLLFEAIRGGVGSLAFLAGASISAGVVLSLLAALYPAATAARMVPADALRSNV
jgi:hypothetical protein